MSAESPFPEPTPPERWVKLPDQTVAGMVTRAMPYDDKFIGRLSAEALGWAAFVRGIVERKVPPWKHQIERQSHLLNTVDQWLKKDQNVFLDPPETNAERIEIPVKAEHESAKIIINPTNGAFTVERIYVRLSFPF